MRRWLKIIIFIFIIILLLFIIDLICIFKINRPLFAIKDKNDYVYKGLFYDVYNCYEYVVPQIKIKGAKFTCTYVIENKESMYIETEVENVSINISNVSKTGATITIKDTNNEPYTYGEWYKIEKEIDDKWYEIKTIIDNYGFNSIGYLPDENNLVKFIINWEWLYGRLSKGKYRILKEVDNKYISVTFNIEN